MKLILPDETYAALLGPFRQRLYTPKTHNQMRIVLRNAGITSNLDDAIKGFANVGDQVSKYIADKARRLR